MKRYVKISLLLFCILGLSGCTQSPLATLTTSENTPAVNINTHLVISTDFGKNIIFDEELEITLGTNTLEVLEGNVDFTTAYGGGFLTSIEGIKSGFLKQPIEREDWFLYINGILSNVGGFSYNIQEGDVIHWYYRDWGFREAVSAIISDFPAPLEFGYGGKNVPTTIWYEDGWKDEAKQLQKSLTTSGVSEVIIRNSSDISTHETENNHLIIIGPSSFQPINEVNQNWDRLGMFCKFNSDGLEIYSEAGNLSRTYTSGAGVIFAMQNPFNPKGTGACENICIFVTGTDDISIMLAVETLSNNSQSLKYYAGATIIDGNIKPLP